MNVKTYNLLVAIPVLTWGLHINNWFLIICGLTNFSIGIFAKSKKGK